MNPGSAYLVVRKLPGRDPEFLRLEGTFQYPVWEGTPRKAEQFTPAKAAQAQQAFGGELLLATGDLEDITKRVRALFDLTPSTSRNPFDPSPYGSYFATGEVPKQSSGVAIRRIMGFDPADPLKPKPRMQQVPLNAIYGKFGYELRKLEPWAVKLPSPEAIERFNALFMAEVKKVLEEKATLIAGTVKDQCLDTADHKDLDALAIYGWARSAKNVVEGKPTREPDPTPFDQSDEEAAAEEAMLLVWNGKKR